MKKLLDVLTVVLLAGAFILAFYTGFVKTNPVTGSPALETVPLAIISVVGAIVLFAVGCGSTAAARSKSETMTKSFVGLLVVQAASVVGMATIMLFLLLEMFPLTSIGIRILYIVFAMIGVLGYIDALLYTEAVIGDGEDEEAEDDDDGEDEDDDYDDYDDYDDDDEDDEEDIDAEDGSEEDEEE